MDCRVYRQRRMDRRQHDGTSEFYILETKANQISSEFPDTLMRITAPKTYYEDRNQLSDRLYRDMSQAARNLKITKKRFVLSAIRRMANSNKASDENITASLNKSFSENPDLNKAWWELEENWDR